MLKTKKLKINANQQITPTSRRGGGCLAIRSCINSTPVAVFSVLILIFTSVVPVLSVNAAQLDNRSLQISSSAPGGYYVGGIGPGGGRIFHIDGTTHYEAAPADWAGGSDPTIQWGCHGQNVPGASGTAIGTGESNTQAIVDFHNDDSNFGGNDYYTYGGDYGDIGCSSGNNGAVAAKTVSELNLNGQSDWFLPSRDELNAMYQNLRLESLGGFASATYWSSTEASEFIARIQNFSTGNQLSGLKMDAFRVRPARTFTHTPEPTTHTFSFDIATTASVGAFRFEYCSNDPFPGEPCEPPLGLDVSGFTVAAQSGASGFAKDATNTTTNEIVVSRGTSQSFTSSDTITFDFSDIINPSEANTEFFVRIYSYDGDDITTASVVDDGGLASSTAETIEVTARVQETIQFCVYTGVDCNAGGANIDLGILNTSTTETGTSYVDVGTNARHGVTLQFIGDTLTSGSFSITAFGSSPATSSIGTEQFGLRIGSITTGGQNAEVASPFDTMNSNEYLLDPNTHTTFGVSSGPVELTTYELEYAANVAALTENGVYITSIEFMATGQF